MHVKIPYNSFPDTWPPEVFIALILLVSWMETDEAISNLEVLDFFAGAARVARGARALGLKAAAFDIGYHNEEKVFDINSSGGFTFLFCNPTFQNFNHTLQLVVLKCVPQFCK